MPARPPSRAARIVLLLVTAVALVTATGCGPGEASRFDPQRADVVAARGDARLATANALATVTGGRLTEASARIDSCTPGEDDWKDRDPWALRCHYSYANALLVDDIDEAAAVVGDGLAAQGCDHPRQLADLLARWSELNPGEPGPGDPDFRPGVVPPTLTRCEDLEVWVRVSSPDDPLLVMTAAAAASTSDPTVVTARPFTDAELDRLRMAGEYGRVVLFVTARQLYHEEPR